MCRDNYDDSGWLDLSTLDAEIAVIARLLIVARECGFTKATAAIERDIVEDVLPGMVVLAALTNGDARAAVTERYRRLKQMLG